MVEPKVRIEAEPIAAVQKIVEPIDIKYSGGVYENEDLATTNDARRFETTATKLKDVVIQVSVFAQAFGNATNQRFVVQPGGAMGFTHVDLSHLYFRNVVPGEHGQVNILGVLD